MKSQITNTLLMIEPVAFAFNAETAVNNYYQQANTENQEAIQTKALQEFTTFVEKLRAVGVDVIVIKDTLTPQTPDSIFPNNWISFHQDATIGLYPMFAENRRKERREDILEIIEEKGFNIEQIVDYSQAEEEAIFLEGTGSMILDRVHQKAYLAQSPRSDQELFIEFCEDFEYTPIIFSAYQTVDGKRELIYHTNVMMCVADKYAVICLDSIDDKKEKKMVVEALQNDGKEIIAISEEQVTRFAGNMLQVQGKDSSYLVMSQQAYEALTNEQIAQIEKYNPILYSDLQTIEKNGGGSARCMMAEVFLPKK